MGDNVFGYANINSVNLGTMKLIIHESNFLNRGKQFGKILDYLS